MMKKKIIITGSQGFVGKNLCVKLKEINKYELFLYDQENNEEELYFNIKDADIIIHLAGVNRPVDNKEYQIVNTGFIKQIIDYIKENQLKCKIIFSSSTQAELDNPYGISKRKAEDELIKYSYETNNNIDIYRLSNIFGKWCRPNYNSVVATFCHNIARNISIKINNPENEIKLIYIDDIIEDIIKCLEEDVVKYKGIRYVKPAYTVTVGELARIIKTFRTSRDNLIMPDFSDPFIKKLYTTYLSYLPENELNYKILTNKDDRGNLTELLKSLQFGQIFVSTTKPGVIRGNHYHHTKVEKFCIIKGKGRVNLRNIHCENIISYEISGENIEIIDIPPGYTHNIENIGSEEMIVLFWANEIFSKEYPDTYIMKV